MLSGSRHALDYLESHDLTGIVFPLHGSPLVTRDLEDVDFSSPAKT